MPGGQACSIYSDAEQEDSAKMVAPVQRDDRADPAGRKIRKRVRPCNLNLALFQKTARTQRN